MAAYSYHYVNHPSFIDSIFLPNNLDNSSNIDLPSQSCFPSEPLVQEIHGAVESSCTVIDHNSSSKVAFSDNEPSVTKKHSKKQSKQSRESSTVVDKVEIGEQVTQKIAHMAKKRKLQSKAAKEHKEKKQKKLDGVKKSEEKETKPDKKEEVKIGEAAPKGYIHVRARRGQATDSHSLAERVRREKISERMKMLQRLVPGCDKVTGRAVMLDEIINYVQSLQNQVEFLSMKLASVNPMFYDFGMDLSALMVKPERLSMEPPFPSEPQCSPAEPTHFADTSTNIAATTAFSTPNNYPFLDSSISLLLQHGQRPIAFPQESDSFLWDMEDQRQNFLNPSGFSNNLCSFH